jgi:gas vesicle protein
MEETIMNKDLTIGFGIGLLTGAFIGGVLALLFAPESGAETRQLIADKATEVVEIVREKTGGVIDTVKEAESEANRRGQAAVKALKS